MFSLTTLIIVLLVVLNHNVADYMFQKGSWAMAKYKDNIALTKHVGLYVLLWTPLLVLLYQYTGHKELVLFYPVTFAVHWLQDYTTSKWTHYLSEQQNWGGDSLPRTWDFFVVLAYDQVLHYVQLFITLHLLTST